MKLEDYRKSKNLTYLQLAKVLGMGKTAVYHICNENVKTVTLPVARQIVLKTFSAVDYEDLILGEPNE